MNWRDPQTLWLNITNIVLAVVTVLALLIGIAGVGWEVIRRRRRDREMAHIDEELHAMFGGGEVGLTMADGGEPVDPQAPRE